MKLLAPQNECLICNNKIAALILVLYHCIDLYRDHGIIWTQHLSYCSSNDCFFFFFATHCSLIYLNKWFDFFCICYIYSIRASIIIIHFLMFWSKTIIIMFFFSLEKRSLINSNLIVQVDFFLVYSRASSFGFRAVWSRSDIILISIPWNGPRASPSGDGERAAVHYQHAVQLKPSHYVAMVNLARLMRSSNGSKEAEIWYKR